MNTSKFIDHTYNGEYQPKLERLYDDRYQNICDWCRGTGIAYSQWTSWTNASGTRHYCTVCEGSGVMTCTDYEWHGEECNGGVSIGAGCYCNFHGNERQERLDRAREAALPYMGDVPPDWFDPTYAGEVWSEEDY